MNEMQWKYQKPISAEALIQTYGDNRKETKRAGWVFEEQSRVSYSNFNDTPGLDSTGVRTCPLVRFSFPSFDGFLILKVYGTNTSPIFKKRSNLIWTLLCWRKRIWCTSWFDTCCDIPTAANQGLSVNAMPIQETTMAKCMSKLKISWRSDWQNVLSSEKN